MVSLSLVTSSCKLPPVISVQCHVTVDTLHNFILPGPVAHEYVNVKLSGGLQFDKLYNGTYVSVQCFHWHRGFGLY